VFEARVDLLAVVYFLDKVNQICDNIAEALRLLDHTPDYNSHSANQCLRTKFVGC